MANGEICYLQTPATDVEPSARFYTRVFGWTIRTSEDGHVAFDDASGHVSGTWIVERPPSREPGLLPYIQVDSVEAALKNVTDSGGEVVSPMTPQGAPKARAKRSPHSAIPPATYSGSSTRDGPPKVALDPLRTLGKAEATPRRIWTAARHAAAPKVRRGHAVGMR